VLLLVTGASGVGKTTVRKLLQPQLAPEVDCVELWDLCPYPRAQNLEWRQQTTELAVQRAVQLQPEGRHFLVCGDPIPAVEVAAAPSATQLDAIAFTLLDAESSQQAARLTARGDDQALLPNHHGFADWMRDQATNPLHMLEVVTTNAWDQMNWDRIPALAPNWHVNVIDTTNRTAEQVAATVLTWIRSAIAGNEPLLHITDPPTSLM
jgi:broad-specificity NMP kinase